MKRLITILIELFVLLGLSYGITYYTHTKFIDYSFLIGLIITVSFYFFTSKGGFTSDNFDVIVQATTGTKMERQKFEFKTNLFFYTSLAYTILTLIAFLIYYRSYF